MYSIYTKNKIYTVKVKSTQLSTINTIDRLPQFQYVLNEFINKFYACSTIRIRLSHPSMYLFIFIFFSDGLNKVFKDGNTKFVITTPDLLRKITQATAGLPDIKVGMKN